MLLHLMLSCRSLRLSSFLFILFSLLCSISVILTIPSSSSLIHSSASDTVLFAPGSFIFPLFLIEGYLLYNIVLVSAMHPHESAIGIHMTLPLEPPSHLSSHATPLSCHRAQFEFPESYSKFPLAISFTYGSVYVSMLFSPFPSSPDPVSIILFSMSVSPLLSYR